MASTSVPGQLKSSLQENQKTLTLMHLCLRVSARCCTSIGCLALLG